MAIEWRINMEGGNQKPRKFRNSSTSCYLKRRVRTTGAKPNSSTSVSNAYAPAIDKPVQKGAQIPNSNWEYYI